MVRRYHHLDPPRGHARDVRRGRLVGRHTHVARPRERDVGAALIWLAPPLPPVMHGAPCSWHVWASRALVVQLTCASFGWCRASLCRLRMRLHGTTPLRYCPGVRPKRYQAVTWEVESRAKLARPRDRRRHSPLLGIYRLWCADTLYGQIWADLTLFCRGIPG